MKNMQPYLNHKIQRFEVKGVYIVPNRQALRDLPLSPFKTPKTPTPILGGFSLVTLKFFLNDQFLLLQ